MIPFDLETWKANPDCEVWFDGKRLYDCKYFKDAIGYDFVGLSEGFIEYCYAYDIQLKLPETKPRPNADVIRAYADGLDIYYYSMDDGVEEGWYLYSIGNLVLIGDPYYKWHIGKPKE